MQARLLERRLDIRNRKHNFKTYPNSFIGSEAIPHILDLGLAEDEDEAIEFGQQLIESNIIRHVVNEHSFKNGHYFYQFTLKFHQYVVHNMHIEEQVWEYINFRVF